jgi:hypothetical protein
MENVFLYLMLALVVTGPMMVFGCIACAIERLVKEPDVSTEIESARRRGDVEIIWFLSINSISFSLKRASS